MATLDPKIRQQQLTYIAQLGTDSDFTLNTDAAPKAEFTRLAVEFLGWITTGRTPEDLEFRKAVFVGKNIE
ncbi:uncharacterized protein N0V89_000756 [Didymosphaeria variabile]|uniref:Uncharacterized protein n=1 Tax=Didymosphaeria variabile TaxID=1932322 RepID=A0A9W8XVS7_9PLEO|nr:uncharacterized protein N0V89_000756 [Didymosphaeria variabile]KAJ4360196.1 hypothetical protein N0V89_000756 [Didymosphaeria variabile]